MESKIIPKKGGGVGGMFTWKPLVDRWVVRGPRFGNPDASASGSLKLACRKLSELQKSRSGYCCMGGKESKRSVTTQKQTQQVCQMKGQVSKVMQGHCVRLNILHISADELAERNNTMHISK